MKLSISVCAALVAMCTSTFASEAKINVMWVAGAPEVPEGLQIACVSDGKALQPGKTCPVIQYQGTTTWAFGYKDNRTSLALVSYDGDGKIIRNVEHEGARYIVKMTADRKGKTVTIAGEESKTIIVPWTELGA